MRRWYFWVLAPVMLAAALGMPFLVDPPTWQGHVVLYAISATLLLATLGLAAPRRFGWALRGVAAAILLAYMGYAATEAIAWWNGKPFGFGSSRARSNLFNALRGLVFFGLPAAYFLLRGRSGSAVDALLEHSSAASDHEAVEQPDAADEARATAWAGRGPRS